MLDVFQLFYVCFNIIFIISTKHNMESRDNDSFIVSALIFYAVWNKYIKIIVPESSGESGGGGDGDGGGDDGLLPYVPPDSGDDHHSHEEEEEITVEPPKNDEVTIVV